MRVGIVAVLLLAVMVSGCGDDSNGDGSSPPRIVLIGEPAGVSEGRTFRSDDLGQHWESIANPATNGASGPPFPSFDLVTSEVGFGVGVTGEGVLRTVDGGTSWPQAGVFPLPEGGAINGLRFIDEEAGIAAGNVVVAEPGIPLSARSSGLFLYTDDGGLHWSTADTMPSPVAGSAEVLCGTLNGLAVALGQQIIAAVPRPPLLMASPDRGHTWASILDGYPGGDPPRRMSCAGERTIWAASVRQLFRSRDRGSSWEDQTPSLPAAVGEIGIDDVHFTDESHGALLAGNQLTEQLYMVTSNGGRTWQAFPPPGPLRAIVPVVPGVTFGLPGGSSGGLFLTRDGGKTWATVALPPGITFVNDIEVAHETGQ